MAHAKGMMRTDVVVLFEPLIDDGLGLAGGAKPVSVENLCAKGCVEALVVAVLPW
jgi:hypothetical protein